MEKQRLLIHQKYTHTNSVIFMPAYGVLVKAEPKALQVLMGHAKIKTTMDIYADAQDELQRETAETISDYITSLTLQGTDEDMEIIFQNIQNLELDKLEEKEVKRYKLELMNLATIPRLEEQTKELILKLSSREDGAEGIGQDSQVRLDLIYSILSTLEQLRTQTKNIRRNPAYGNDYDNIFNYVRTTQNLLQIIDKANEKYITM